MERELGAEGLQRLRMSELTQDEHHYIRQLFRTAIQPLLSPQIVDAHHPFPHLASKTLHVGVRLSRKKSEFWGLIPMPPSVPELLFLPEQNGICRYVPLEEVLLFYADSVFEMYSTLEKVVFCVTRNADINPDDEPFAPDGREIDLRAKMEKLLRERRRLCVVRVELSAPISGHFAELFRKRFDISGEQIFVSCEAPLCMDYAFSLGEHLPEARRAALSDPPFTPQQPAMLLPGQSLLRAALKRDLFLSYPYESMEPFLQMVREAANAPDVLSIRITIYRLARKAKLVDYLCAAAENGKDVSVLIELRAALTSRTTSTGPSGWRKRAARCSMALRTTRSIPRSASSLCGSAAHCAMSRRSAQAIITRRPQSSTRTSPLSQPTRASARTPLPSSAIWRSATLRAATARCSLRRTS